ncbi:MAG: NUDIX domain-containing protein [Candidatus Taylorbacteria bacterium]|nr:NUDIX domain-containing protein [Candidatus Taylorbacteria bacterium]
MIGAKIKIDDNHVCVGVPHKIDSRTSHIYFLAFPSWRLKKENETTRQKMKFPGGRQEPGEKTNETLRREFREEISINGCEISFDENPLLVFPEKDERKKGGVTHWKFAFLVYDIKGELRTQTKAESRKLDDEGRVIGQTFLGVPEWVEAAKLLRTFQVQRFSTRFHFLSFIFAMNCLMKTNVSDVAKRYGSMIEPFDEIVTDFKKLMESSSDDIESFDDTLRKYGALLGIRFHD